jgi:hypothetical protein
MIQKLMESFDIDVAKLAGYSEFDANTLTVTKYGDVEDQLDDLEANFWNQSVGSRCLRS